LHIFGSDPLKGAGDFLVTVFAATVDYVVGNDREVIPPDDDSRAFRAIGILTGMTGNVADVDIEETDIEPYLTGALKGLDRCTRHIRQLKVGYETREMPGCALAKTGCDPGSESAELDLAVIVTRNYIGDNLDMHIPLALSSQGILEDGFEIIYIGYAPIEIVRESLNVNTVNIKIRTNRIKCCFRHVTVSNIIGMQAGILCKLAYLDSVLEPHRRLIIGPGYTNALSFVGESNDLGRFDKLRLPLRAVAGLLVGYLPVLATDTPQIAS